MGIKILKDLHVIGIDVVIVFVDWLLRPSRFQFDSRVVEGHHVSVAVLAHILRPASLFAADEHLGVLFSVQSLKSRNRLELELKNT